MGPLEGICWALTIAATLLAGFLVVDMFIHLSVYTAAQQVAQAAVAAVTVSVPYVCTRAVQEVGGRTLRRRDAELLVHKLAEQLGIASIPVSAPPAPPAYEHLQSQREASKQPLILDAEAIETPED